MQTSSSERTGTYTDVLGQALRDGGLDLAFMPVSDILPTGLAPDVLFSEPQVVVGRSTMLSADVARSPYPSGRPSGGQSAGVDTGGSCRVGFGPAETGVVSVVLQQGEALECPRAGLTSRATGRVPSSPTIKVSHVDVIGGIVPP